MFCPRKSSERLMRSCSLAKAMMLPLKETAPMRAPSTARMATLVDGCRAPLR